MKQFIWTYGRRDIITNLRLKHRILKFQFMTIRTNVTRNTTKVTNRNKNRFISVSPNPKTDNVYIPSFRRNHKENAYFAKLDKGKGFDVDVEVSKLVSKPAARVQINQFLCLPVIFLVLLVILDQIVLY